MIFEKPTVYMIDLKERNYENQRKYCRGND